MVRSARLIIWTVGRTVFLEVQLFEREIDQLVDFAVAFEALQVDLAESERGSAAAAAAAEKKEKKEKEEKKE